MFVSLLMCSLIIHQVILQDVINKTSESNSTLAPDVPTPQQNGSILMTRITQPSEPFHVSRELDLIDAPRPSDDNMNMKDFKPSPPVQTYEFNKVPVKPAIPEAKFFNEKSSGNSWGQNSWQDQPRSYDWSGGDNSWNTKVRFPTNSGASTSGNSKGDQHSPNVIEVGYPNRKNTESYPSGRPTNFPKKSINDIYGPPEATGMRPPQHKTFVDYNLMEKPPYYEEEVLYPTSYGASYEINRPHKTQGYGGYGGDYGAHGVEYGGHGGGNLGFYKSPWKKIIKFLATIIPIGLLISALTPNVITVQNNTEPLSFNFKTKHRSEESTEEFSKRLSSSLQYFNKLNDDGCENKVLCELLVSASFSKNAEEYVKTLLDNFVKEETLENQKDDLLKIFDAVKNEDCSPITCKSVEKLA